MAEGLQKDCWRIPTFLMWLVFMLVGLAPEAIFQVLQSAAGVLRYEALIGSPLVLTVTFAGYLAGFAYSETVHGGSSRSRGVANATQIGSVSLIAFLPVTLEALEFAMAMRYTNLLFVSVVVLSTATIKLAAWLYLLTFLVRYYVSGNQAVFAHMASFFPSARGLARQEADGAAEGQSTFREAQAFEEHGNAKRLSE